MTVPDHPAGSGKACRRKQLPVHVVWSLPEEIRSNCIRPAERAMPRRLWLNYCARTCRLGEALSSASTAGRRLIATQLVCQRPKEAQKLNLMQHERTNYWTVANRMLVADAGYSASVRW